MPGSFMPCAALAALALVLGLVTLAGPVAASGSRMLLQAGTTSLSGRAIVIAKDRHRALPSKIFAVQTSNGKRVRVQLEDDRQLDGIHTGMDVELSGQWDQQQRTTRSADTAQAAAASARPTEFKAAFISKSSGKKYVPPQAMRLSGASVGPGGNTMSTGSITLSFNKLITAEIPTLFVPINAMDSSKKFCPGTARPKTTVTDLRKHVFAELNPDEPTVSSTFAQCSFGRSRLTQANSKVASIVSLPCSGTSPATGVNWTFSSCSFEDYNGYADAADAYLRSKGWQLEKFPYRVYLIPPSKCDFVGLGYVGCDGSFDCRVWIGADYWDKPQAMVHELGHNLFMGHAADTLNDGTVDEYGDGSCVMGYCCEHRCWNTAHAWQMGWISAQQLDATNLQPGTTVTVTLSSQSTTSRSGLRIVPSWTTGVDPAYVGFRTKAGGDALMSDSYANKVHIVTAPITNSYDSQLTMWQTTLAAAGDAWAYQAAGLVVRVKGFPRGAATVTVCRVGGAETAQTCAAGTDNDCNGLAGAKDPACVALLKTRPRRGL